MSGLKQQCFKLAETLFFDGSKDMQKSLTDLGLSLRTGKNLEDLRTAFRKGVRRGSGKVERELKEAGAMLERVLRLAAVAPQSEP